LKERKLSLEGMLLICIYSDGGSAVTLDQCVQNLISWTSCSIAQAIECVTTHPAKLLGLIDKKGSLSPGLDADLVVVDDLGHLYQTWKFGEKVFDAAPPQVAPKDETKKVVIPRKESLHFGERFTVPEATLKLARVTSPSGVKVH
jgi:adenine deaminase